MANRASPESKAGVPSSWLMPVGRRPVLEAGAAIALATASRFIFPTTATAQEGPRTSVLSRNLPGDPFFALINFGLKLDESFDILAFTQIGLTTDAEVASLPYMAKDEIGDDLVRYSYPSTLIARPNIIIAKKDAETVFKRAVVLGTQDGVRTLKAKAFSPEYGPVEAITPIPYPFGYDPKAPLRFFETQIRTRMPVGRNGLAIARQINTDDIWEMHVFPTMPAKEYIDTWSEGDYYKVASGPK
jgi:hypothetical protein